MNTRFQSTALGADNSPINTTYQPQPEHESESQADRRSTSKIAKLPGHVRERLNQLLAEGLTYPETLQQLGDHATHLNEMDLSRWFHGGHNLWLQQQTWLNHISSTFDSVQDMLKENKAASIHEANLHLAATQMYQAMVGCEPEKLPAIVKEDPEKLFKIIHAIPQYASQALNFQKYKDACDNARAEIQKLRDPKRQLNEEETRIIIDKVDQILGLR